MSGVLERASNKQSLYGVGISEIQWIDRGIIRFESIPHHFEKDRQRGADRTQWKGRVISDILESGLSKDAFVEVYILLCCGLDRPLADPFIGLLCF